MALLTAVMSKFMLPARGSCDSEAVNAVLLTGPAGGVNDRPSIRSCFEGLGVGIRVALHLGGLGVGVRPLEYCFRGLGTGILETDPRFVGLGVLARRTREANLACVTVLLCGGESEISDGAATALW